jgi:hypothetical protein
MDKMGHKRDPRRGEVVKLCCKKCGRTERAVWVRRIAGDWALVIFADSLRDTIGKPLNIIVFAGRQSKSRRPRHPGCCYWRFEEQRNPCGKASLRSN